MTVRQHPLPAQTRGIAAHRRRLASVRRSWTPYKHVRTLALLPIRSPPSPTHRALRIAQRSPDRRGPLGANLGSRRLCRRRRG